MKLHSRPTTTVPEQHMLPFSSTPTSPSPNPSSAKPRPSRKPKLDKENAPPIDPNTIPSPAITNTKLKNSPLPPKPPRPPSSNPLKRKLALEDASVPPSSDSGVKVVVRMRPPQKETDEGDVIIQKISGDSLSINGQSFTFDAVADTEATQLDIFQLVGVPLVENCLAGFNSSVFAYGQTGSGKTYTMWGPANALLEGNLASDQQGLTPRVLERLFSRIDEEQLKHADKQLKYQCHCSFLEIYNEHITDLLDPNQRSLQIREDVKTGVYVENLTEECVSTTKDVTQLLVKGLSNRRTGATSINAESSRSHTVFTCVVESRCKSLADGISSFKTSRINLVDLAGSERQKLTGAAGERLKEAGNINRSLSQLGNLINILAEVSQTGKQRHIPYRDSRLTFLLQESLGGNAKLAMVCAISPAQSSKSETFSTLRFAQRAKAIKNKAVVNEVMQEDVNHLREVIRQLRDELHRIKANGNNPVESNACHSAARIRRSLNLLKSGLNLPLTLTNIDEDGDIEMEIVEEFCVKARPSNETKHLLASEDVHCPEVCYSSMSETKCCTENKSEDLDVITEGGISERDGVMTVSCLEPMRNTKSNYDSASPNKSERDPLVISEDLDVTMEEGISEQDGVMTVTCLEPMKNIRSNNGSASPKKSERDPLVMSVTEKDDIEGSDLGAEAVISFSKPLTRSSPKTLTAQSSPNFQARYHHLAESIHRGLASINTHKRSMALRRSSIRFSLKPQEFKLVFPKIKVDVGVQTFFHDYEKEVVQDSAPSVCICCQNKTEVNLKGINANSNLQLVPIDAPDFVDNSKKQLPKAVEEVLAGSIRREMALEDFCAKQNSEIIQLNRLVQQYKHERECNASICQMREDKIVRLESLVDVVLTNEEFWEEEVLSLANECKVLQEKYENHPEIQRTKIELKKVQEELEQCRNFYELGEREVLLEEIQDLRTQLQFYIDSSTASKRQNPLLQLTYSSNQNLVPSPTIPESTVQSAFVELEQERIIWQEAESRWISLSEELRLELAASRSLAEKRLRELEIERKCSQELNEAMQMAMEGHGRMLEQYAYLEEKHIQLLARHRRIQEGIEDVKKAASKAGVRGAESKFINALAAEISSLKLEREKERRYLRDENKGLQAQLNDTAEAVQAAGELLVRLREAEEAVAAAEKRAAEAELEAGKVYEQVENLKRIHEKEVCTLNELLLEARLSTKTKQPPYDGGFIMPDRDLGLVHSNKDDKWKEGFEPFYNGQGGEWFSGYDRCNI